jgi:hypothetical protein
VLLAARDGLVVDPVREAQHLGAARAALSHHPTSASFTWGRSRVMSRAKVVGLMTLGLVLGTAGLAAANALPDPAQNAVSRVFDRVGISIPAADHPNDAPSVQHPASTGAEISEIATTTELKGVDKGALISSTASGGMSQAGQHGNAGGQGSERPPAPASAGKGADIADEASGGRSSAGAANGTGGAP